MKAGSAEGGQPTQVVHRIGPWQTIMTYTALARGTTMPTPEQVFTQTRSEHREKASPQTARFVYYNSTEVKMVNIYSFKTV